MHDQWKKGLHLFLEPIGICMTQVSLENFKQIEKKFQTGPTQD